jgi:glycine/D-amino acid oxidase-like deaminating enzyme
MRGFEKTRITTYEAAKRGVILRTPEGGQITAKRAVFCTGYESEKYLPHKLARITTDFCFATGKLRASEKFEKCHVVEHAENYFYASTFEDWVLVGAEEDRLISPGEREKVLDRKADKLVERVQPHLSQIKLRAAQKWAGLFAKSKDSLPYLGSSDHLPRSLFVLGYGGNGIASSAMLAPMVAELVAKGKSKDASIFSFDR